MRLTSPAGALSQLASLPDHIGPAGWGLLTESGGCLSQNMPSHPTGFLSNKPYIQPSNGLVKIFIFILLPISGTSTAGRPLHLSVPADHWPAPARSPTQWSDWHFIGLNS